RTLRTDSGQKQNCPRQELPRLADGAWMGRADHSPYRRQTMLTDQVRTPFRHQLRDLVPHVATVGQNEILNLASARVRGLHNAEDARAVPPAGGEIGIERVASE